MELKLVKSLWGIEPETGDGFDPLFARIVSAGFQAIELERPTWQLDQKKLKAALEKHGLSMICQIHTCGGWMDGDEYVYCESNKVADHIASFAKLVAECAALEPTPVLINSHSGHDSWDADEAEEYFIRSLEVEADWGVKVVHETHRTRQLFSPYQARKLLSRPALDTLGVNADLSHWVCACEKVFDDKDPRDDWWPAVLASVASHCGLIHCRVGHTQGPQVNHPDAPEHALTTAAHLDWWSTIWKAQAERGCTVTYAEPEFGPLPYMQALPYTQQPVSDLWEVNQRMAERVTERFAQLAASDTIFASK